MKEKVHNYQPRRDPSTHESRWYEYDCSFPIDRHPYRKRLGYDQLRACWRLISQTLERLDPEKADDRLTILRLLQEDRGQVPETIYRLARILKSCALSVEDSEDEDIDLYPVPPPRWTEIEKVMATPKDEKVQQVLILPIAQWQEQILTPKRVEILEALESAPVDSISDLARRIGRSRPNVVTDVHLLEHYGLVALRKEGNRTVPIAVPFEIRITSSSIRSASSNEPDE